MKDYSLLILKVKTRLFYLQNEKVTKLWIIIFIIFQEARYRV